MLTFWMSIPVVRQRLTMPERNYWRQCLGPDKWSSKTSLLMWCEFDKHKTTKTNTRSGTLLSTGCCLGLFYLELKCKNESVFHGHENDLRKTRGVIWCPLAVRKPVWYPATFLYTFMANKGEEPIHYGSVYLPLSYLLCFMGNLKTRYQEKCRRGYGCAHIRTTYWIALE